MTEELFLLSLNVVCSSVFYSSFWKNPWVLCRSLQLSVLLSEWVPCRTFFRRIRTYLSHELFFFLLSSLPLSFPLFLFFSVTFLLSLPLSLSLHLSSSFHLVFSHSSLLLLSISNTLFLSQFMSNTSALKYLNVHIINLDN